MAGWNYQRAGVNLDEAERFVHRIGPLARRTARPEVLSAIGGFAGLCRIPRRFRDPVLVSGTDGVGTKLKVACLAGRHDTIGIDLVAMCANDILVSGAEPLFFLDYIATGRLDAGKLTQVVRGIVRGCREAGCALIGGETAEMPGMYPDGEYDLAGFMVGVVERSKIIDGSRIKPGDILIGLASAGLHSNGFSLARKVLFEVAGLDLDGRIAGSNRSVGEELLVPTRIYVKAILGLLRMPAFAGAIKGMAHITGGGISGNLSRILPARCAALIRRSAWPVPSLFRFIQEKGGVPETEMYRTFNMGIGMILAVSSRHAGALLSRVRGRGQKAFVIGEVTRGSGEVRYV